MTDVAPARPFMAASTNSIPYGTETPVAGIVHASLVAARSPRPLVSYTAFDCAVEINHSLRAEAYPVRGMRDLILLSMSSSMPDFSRLHRQDVATADRSVLYVSAHILNIRR